MTERPDPGPPVRVRFRERQRLRIEDLAEEQAYRLGAGDRHRHKVHRWGLVAGLGLAVEGPNLVLDPGLAVDRFGHELWVPEEVEISPQALDAGLAELGSEPGDELDVGIVYRTRLETRNGTEPSKRWYDEARLRFTAVSSKEDPPPDDETAGTVFLGRIRYRSGNPEIVESSLRWRRQAGLAAGAVTAPGGRASFEIGNERDPNANRFVVRLGDAGGETAARLTCRAADGAEVDGVLRLSALRLAPGSGGRGSALAWTRPAAPAAAAAPRRITLVETGETPRRELRVELARPETGDPARHRFTVGARNEGQPGFHPALAVVADGVSIVDGHLLVRGELLQGPIQPDPNDPRFAPAVIESWSRGTSAALQPLLLEGAALGLHVSKEAAVENARPGEEVDYGYFVSNSGTLPLHVDVQDQVDGAPLSRVIRRGETVLPGETAQLLERFEVPANVSVPELWTTVTCNGRTEDGRQVEAVVRHRLSIGDDFTRIRGIEATGAQWLRKAGIFTFAELAARPPEEVLKVFERTLGKLADKGLRLVRDWQEQARRLMGPEPSPQGAESP